MGEAWEQGESEHISQHAAHSISLFTCWVRALLKKLLAGGNHRRGKRAVTQSILRPAFSRFAFRTRVRNLWTKRVAPCLTPVRNINQRNRRTKAFCPPTPAMRVLLLLLALNAALTLGAEEHHRSKRGVIEFITGWVYKGADIVFRSFSEASGYKVTRLPPKATEKSYSEHQAGKKSSEKSYSNEKKTHFAT
jgi:hypothetical protein